MDDLSTSSTVQPVPNTSTISTTVSPDSDVLELAAVKRWLAKIKEAKRYFQADFERMKDNMEFAAGFQRRGQSKMDSDEIIVNLVIRTINQKVAQLYARDPKAIAKRRKRMDYRLWDGDMQTLMQAVQEVSTAVPSGLMPSPNSLALIADFNAGDAWRKLIKKIGDALEIIYQFQCDNQQPSFKFQMKQLVRRVVTTGVGFVRLNCVIGDDEPLSSSGTDDSIEGMKKRVAALVDEIQQRDLPPDHPHMEDLRELMDAIDVAEQSGEEAQGIQEKIVFDFPESTAIILDPECKSLKGFIGARWIAQEHIVSLEDANSYFELRGDDAIKTGGELITYSEDGKELGKGSSATGSQTDGLPPHPMVCVFEVFDREHQNTFFVVDGYKKYAQAPSPVNPKLTRFWPIFALAFNDIEVKRGLKATCYPPSDVQLMKAAQQEWNRTRQAFREQRQANIPFYMGKAGVFTDKDKNSLADHENSEIIWLQGLPQDADVNKYLAAFKPAPIDPLLYDVRPQEQDIQLAVGAQQADLGAAQPHVTATNSSIAEQSRINGVSSNADDLDDLLTDLAQASGEVILRVFTKDTVIRIAGQGAECWPDNNKVDFINELYLTVVAASSGRPNRAVDIANAERMMPIVLQAMQNPQLWPFVTYMMRILDDRLDIADFMPPMPMVGAQQPIQQGQQAGVPPGAPTPPQPGNATMPLSGPQAGQMAHSQFGALNGGSQPIPVQRTQ